MSGMRENSDPSPGIDAFTVEPTEMLVKESRRAAGEETRERILDAAQHLFAKHGFDATATKTIAQRAEVPNSLIFYYFPTKRAILESLIQERNVFPKLHAVMDVPHDADIRSTLIHIGIRYLETSKQNPEVPRILLREFRSHPEVAARFEVFREEVIQLITSYLTKAMKAGELREGNVQVMARIFVYNLIVAATIARPPNDPRQFIEEVVDVLLCGCYPTERP